jgi:NAD(P)-dependent dehydrogenase (short-subunit alcohol dehydrogenase family)
MQDKVVVIVGATGGIGAALTHKLAGLGAKLVLAARNPDRLAALAAQASPALAAPTDITDPDQVEALFAAAIAHYGRVDVLVNAAGAGVMKQFNKIEPADLDAMLAVNLKGSFYTCQAAANLMKEQKGGHICNVIGILGKHSMAMAAAYSASKFGAVGFSKCMAEEVKRYGIKFTLFYFGGVDTAFWDEVALKVDRSKMLSAETAANAILFALTCDPLAVPMEINIQPESHLFF